MVQNKEFHSPYLLHCSVIFFCDRTNCELKGKPIIVAVGVSRQVWMLLHRLPMVFKSQGRQRVSQVLYTGYMLPLPPCPRYQILDVYYQYLPLLSCARYQILGIYYHCHLVLGTKECVQTVPTTSPFPQVSNTWCILILLTTTTLSRLTSLHRGQLSKKLIKYQTL